MANTINASALAQAVSGDPNAQNILNCVSQWNNSPTLVSLLDTFLSSPNATISTTSVNQTNNSSVSIQSSLFDDFNASNIDQVETAGVGIAHELAHATMTSAQYISNPASISQAQQDDETAEGTASVQSFNVANEFNEWNAQNLGGSDIDPQSANNNSELQNKLSNDSALGDTQAEMISDAASWMANQPPSGFSLNSGVTYNKWIADFTAVQLCDGSSTTIAQAGLNPANIATSSVTASNFNVIQNSNGGWTLNATGIRDTSGNTYSLQGSGASTTPGSITCTFNKTSAGGQNSAFLEGQGASDDISGATVAVASASEADITGDSNTITSGSSSTTEVQGSNNSITCGANDDLNSDGNDNTYNFSDGGTLDLAAGDTGETIAGTGFTLNAAGLFSGVISGADSTLNLAANSNSSVSLAGSGLVANSVGNALSLSTAGISTTVQGSNNNLQCNADDDLSLEGSNNIINATSDFIDIANGDSDDDVRGAGDTIDAGGNSSVGLFGNNDTFDLTANSGTFLDLNGTGETVDTTGNSLTLGSNTSVTIDGTSAVSFWSGGANNSLVTLDDPGSTVIIAAGDSNDDVNGSGETIDAGGNSSVGLFGNNDTFDLTANSDTFLDLNGTGETVDTTGNSLTLGSNTSVTIDGTSAVSFWSGGASDSLVTLDDPGSTINVAAGDSNDDVNGSGETINAGSDSSVGLTGNNDTFNLTANSNTFLDLNGTGETVDTIGNSLTLGSNTSATIDGTSAVSFWSGGASDSSVTLDGSGSQVSLTGKDTEDTVDGSYATINGDDVSSFTLNGDNNVFTGSGSDISISGQSNDIYLSNATIDVAGDDGVDIFGSNDDIIGAAGDTFTVTGGDDLVDADDSDIYFDGGYGGDDVDGGGDTGSGWSGYYGGYGYDGGYGSGYGGGGYGYAGFTKWKGQAPSAATAATYAGKSGTVYENAAWADRTVTWSFASATGAASATSPFSHAIGDPQQQAAVEQAFQTWARASGLNFEEVAAGTPSDIQVGFSDLDPANTNQIGQTQVHRTGGRMEDAQVELEDPAQAPLTTGSDGQLMYASTDASFEQVALHEIGHALGVADNDQAGSIMNYLLDSSNTGLNASDVAGIQSLYGSTVQASAGSASWQQLVQAMATFDGGTGMGETTPDTAMAELYQQALVAPAQQHHVVA